VRYNNERIRVWLMRGTKSSRGETEPEQSTMFSSGTLPVSATKNETK